MLDFLIDNIYVEFGGQIFQQVIGIPMGTNCAPLLADLFLYTYEAEFIQNLIKSGLKNTAKNFNFTFRYIDDVITLNNPRFEEYIDFIYPEELEIKDTTESKQQASYLDLLLMIDQTQCLSTKIYDKRDDFNFQIVNSHFSLVTYQNHQLMVCLFHNLYAMQELVQSTMIFLLEVIY